MQEREKGKNIQGKVRQFYFYHAMFQNSCDMTNNLVGES